MNATKVLDNINMSIAELSVSQEGSFNPYRITRKGYSGKRVFKICATCNELSIFDWWNETLSMSQLRQMKKFVETAIQLGFMGYVCFKVGAKGCSHGMWAYKEESATGYSPDGDVLYHSFRSGDNYYDMKLNDEWMHDKYATEENDCPDFTLSQIKAELAKA